MEIIRTAVSYSALLTALLIGSGNVHTAEAYSPTDLTPIPYSDADRACARQNAYFDAGTDPASQVGVVYVVVNRSRDARWPGTLCEVVYQGGNKKQLHTCQFSWYCDGKKESMVFFPILERSAEAVAAVLDTGVDDPTHGATCYHRSDVKPSWARQLKPTARIGVHIFYRC
jgi:N-acetylmuramoyl-L-alanine amidase